MFVAYAWALVFFFPGVWYKIKDVSHDDHHHHPTTTLPRICHRPNSVRKIFLSMTYFMSLLEVLSKLLWPRVRLGDRCGGPSPTPGYCAKELDACTIGGVLKKDQQGRDSDGPFDQDCVSCHCIRRPTDMVARIFFGTEW